MRFRLPLNIFLIYTKVCNHLQPSTDKHNHPQPSTFIQNHPERPKTTNNHAQPLKTIYSKPQQPTTIHNPQQSPTMIHSYPQPVTTKLRHCTHPPGPDDHPPPPTDITGSYCCTDVHFDYLKRSFIAFWSFDVVSSYHYEAEFTKC